MSYLKHYMLRLVTAGARLTLLKIEGFLLKNEKSHERKNQQGGSMTEHAEILAYYENQGLTSNPAEHVRFLDMLPDGPLGTGRKCSLRI